MKTTLCFAAAACLLAGTAFAADSSSMSSMSSMSGMSSMASKTASVQNELVGVEAAWSKAFVQKDIAALSSIVADDWVGQNDSGKSQNKAGLLALVKSGALTVKSMKNRDVHVRAMGDWAVVQGADDETSSFKGKDTSGAYTWMDVFAKRGGHWVAIASQVTKVSK
ncbi:MAG: nuclear transport factor 2 family protein [Alphaproteobacteria bacterium]|nr:nuclear transport factor 2 family protein [Alphaproteobacteria bacterium]